MVAIETQGRNVRPPPSNDEADLEYLDLLYREKTAQLFKAETDDERVELGRELTNISFAIDLLLRRSS